MIDDARWAKYTDPKYIPPDRRFLFVGGPKDGQLRGVKLETIGRSILVMIDATNPTGRTVKKQAWYRPMYHGELMFYVFDQCYDGALRMLAAIEKGEVER